jgi:hypothetical protein
LTLTISANLAPNTVNQPLGVVLSDGSIRIVSTTPNAFAFFTPPPPTFCDPAAAPLNCCDPTGAGGFNPLVTGNELVAWAGHIENTTITESEFLVDNPAVGNLPGADPGPELFSLPETCSDIVQLGTGAGTCSCPTTGL